MFNLDLVGEMSLEQLENNVETLFGKAKAEELIYTLRSTKIDISIKNKFYAAIYNNIQSQNSVDDILKNPSTISHIINTVEKQVNNLNYTNIKNTQNTIDNEKLQKRIDELLNNKDFLENPLPYMQSFTEKELESIFQTVSENLFQNKKLIQQASVINSNFYKNPTNETYKKSFEQLHQLDSNIDNSEYIDAFGCLSMFAKSHTSLRGNDLYDAFIDDCKKNNINYTDTTLIKLKDNMSLTLEQQEELSLELDNNLNNSISLNNRNQHLQNNVAQTLETNESMQYLEIVLDSNFDMIRDPAENQTEFEYGDLNTIFDDFADTNAMQFDFTDQEPIVEIPPTASSPSEFIQQEMQKQAEEAEKIGDEISEQADLAQDTDKENNYMLEVEEKKGFFSSIKDRFSKFMQKITQKSLPDPNATKAQTTNQSFEAFERKTSIMSTIRSIGDRVTSAVKNISSLNKQNQVPEIRNTATIVGAQKANSQAMEMDNNPTDTNKKSEIIRPKAVQSRPKTNELSSFDQFVKVSNEGNRIEAAAKRDAKGSHNSQDRQQAVVEGSEATSRDDD